MLIAGTGVTVQGQPLGLVILALGILAWIPFYGLSLLRNAIALVESNPRATLIAIAAVCLFIFFL